MHTAFQEALQNNAIDKAWAMWASFSGATAATCEHAYEQGGWRAGDKHDDICTLFKRARRLQATGGHDSEARVAEILEDIS